MKPIPRGSGFVCNLLSAVARKSGLRPFGVLLPALAAGGFLASAWLGGELVYKYKVGLNRTRKPDGPQDWQPVLNEADLPAGQPMRVEVNGTPGVLYRRGDAIYAMGAVCGHAAGPLEKGTFEGTDVTCPLHQSVYDMRDGHVVHGPALYPEPTYEVRTREGRIELKARAE